MRADALSDVLHRVRLTGAVFFHIEGSAPWAAEAPPSRAVAGTLMPRAQHVIEYHVITRGACWGGVVGDAPVALSAGDVIVFPQGDAHVLSSAPGLRAAPTLEAYARVLEQGGPLRVPLGAGDGERTEILCGFWGCDARPFNPLLATLPRVLRARLDPSRGVLATFAEAAAREARERRPGGESVLARLSELMFVEVVRTHLDAAPAGSAGWLAGLRDESVGHALALLHREPGRAWSLEDLARRIGLSRSVLVERFTHLVGEPPMQYLARWRMQVAADLLSSRSASVAEAALEVGYASEAAFSRAFKKQVGVPPAAWRERGRTSAPRPDVRRDGRST